MNESESRGQAGGDGPSGRRFAGGLADRQGNPVRGATQDAVVLFDRALEAFATYRGDPLGLLDDALAEAPGFSMALLAKAWLHALATEPEASRAAAGMLDQVREHRLDTREAAHAEALRDLLAGNPGRAGLVLDRYLMAQPRDALAVQAGHMIDFLRADQRNLRDRIARVLPRWAGVPGRSHLLGMYAFGLEECGDYTAAEDTGREAIEGDPFDSWAHHAVAHVLEMQGRTDDGVDWMLGRTDFWAGEDNFLKVHNWWHLALCHLERDEPAAALALYDGPVRGQRSEVAMAMLDAASLLWRIWLSGADVGNRWEELSEAWLRHADGAHYPFNDMHAAMAHVGAGRPERVEALLAGARAAAGSEIAGWVQGPGLRVLEGLLAFQRQDWAAAVAALFEARRIASCFGGSHAQRDVIDWTLTEAALRAGSGDIAGALAAERLALRPHSPVNRAFLMRSTRANGTVAGAPS